MGKVPVECATDIPVVVFEETVISHGVPDQRRDEERPEEKISTCPLRLGNTDDYALRLKVNGTPTDRLTELAIISRVPGHRKLVLTARVSKLCQRGFSGKERDPNPPEIYGNFIETTQVSILGGSRDPRVTLFSTISQRVDELMGKIPETFIPDNK